MKTISAFFKEYKRVKKINMSDMETGSISIHFLVINCNITGKRFLMSKTFCQHPSVSLTAGHQLYPETIDIQYTLTEVEAILSTAIREVTGLLENTPLSYLLPSSSHSSTL